MSSSSLLLNPPYGGEPYSKVDLPDYEANAVRLTALLTVNSLFWMALLIYQQRQQRHQHFFLFSPAFRQSLLYWWVLSFLILGLGSDYNTKISRSVFQVPLLNTSECNQVLEIAAAVAHRNYEAAKEVQQTQHQYDRDGTATTTTTAFRYSPDLLQEPLGWHKTRPEAYQTTDLQPALDPFTKEERQVLQNLLDRRLGPTVARIYGVPQASIRAQDMFLARYDAPAGLRTGLRRHIDDTDVSFNLLLSTNFTGGGTRFFRRLEERLNHNIGKDDNGDNQNNDVGVFYHAQPQKAGTVLLHNSQILHEGYPIQTGTRFILVGFLTLDQRNPWTGASNYNHYNVGDTSIQNRILMTFMGWYGTWFNFQWAQVRFRQCVQEAASRSKDEDGSSSMKMMMMPLRLVQGWFQTVCTVVGAGLLLFLDVFGTHEYQVLVDDNDEHDNQSAREFRQALDLQFLEDQHKHKHHDNTANWFRGQQIDVNPWTGMLRAALKPRQGKEAHFDEL